MALEFRAATTARAEEAKAKRDAPIMLLSLFELFLFCCGCALLDRIMYYVLQIILRLLQRKVKNLHFFQYTVDTL